MHDDGFMVTISRTTEVVGIDFNMFTDMRPSEQSDARDELDQKMRQYDVDAHLYDCLEEEELPPWVLAKFTKLVTPAQAFCSGGSHVCICVSLCAPVS